MAILWIFIVTTTIKCSIQNALCNEFEGFMLHNCFAWSIYVLVLKLRSKQERSTWKSHPAAPTRWQISVSTTASTCKVLSFYLVCILKTCIVMQSLSKATTENDFKFLKLYPFVIHRVIRHSFEASIRKAHFCTERGLEEEHGQQVFLSLVN